MYLVGLCCHGLGILVYVTNIPDYKCARMLPTWEMFRSIKQWPHIYNDIQSQALAATDDDKAPFLEVVYDVPCVHE